MPGPDPDGRLCPDQIERDLGTRRIGRRIAVWDRITSTNDLAVRACGSPGNDGLVILADEQTAGRGRLGRGWTAPPRSSVLISIVVVPPEEVVASGIGWLTALGAVATAEVVSARIGRDAAIKWPNDVRVDRRKIAGILVERPTPHEPGAAIGIGLNVNLDADDFPADLRPRATSIRIECGGRPSDRSEVARDLIRRLDHWYEAVRSQGPQALNVPWRDRSEHLGQSVRIATPSGSHRGRLVELDLHGGAILDVASEERSGRTVRLSPREILSIEEVPSAG